MATDSGAERRLVEMAFGPDGPGGYADAARRYIGGVLCVPDRLPAVLVGPDATDVEYLGAGHAAVLGRLRSRAADPDRTGPGTLAGLEADREYVEAAHAGGLVPDETTPESLAAAEHWAHGVRTLDGALRYRLAEAAIRLERDLAEHRERSGGRAAPRSLVAAACAPVLDLLDRQPAAFARLGEVVPEFGRTARLVPSYAPPTSRPSRLVPALSALAADSDLDSAHRFTGALTRLGAYRRHLRVPAERAAGRLDRTLTTVRSVLSTVAGHRGDDPGRAEPARPTVRPEVKRPGRSAGP